MIIIAHNQTARQRQAFWWNNKEASSNSNQNADDNTTHKSTRKITEESSTKGDDDGGMMRSYKNLHTQVQWATKTSFCTNGTRRWSRPRSPHLLVLRQKPTPLSTWKFFFRCDLLVALMMSLTVHQTTSFSLAKKHLAFRRSTKGPVPKVSLG